MNSPIASKTIPGAGRAAFPLDQWYVAGLSGELADQPLARTLLNHALVLFRTADGVAALEDRCCHRSLPLSRGTVEPAGVRCGYHGMLYGADGACIDIPGQERIPAKARVRAWTVREKDHILWIWMPKDAGAAPSCEPPDYPHHGDPRYQYGWGVYHYAAPYQLIHDNLLDLSHIGYVHQKTIGGNASLHMNAGTTLTSDERSVRAVRLMPGSVPPPSYRILWPFGETCDRWQEIGFFITYLSIWTGAMVPGEGALDDPARGGLHTRGFHGVTPETDATSHYFWTMAANCHPDTPKDFPLVDKVVANTRVTFEEDKAVIEAQYRNMLRFDGRDDWTDIHVDLAPNRARRMIAALIDSQ